MEYCKTELSIFRHTQHVKQCGSNWIKIKGLN